MASSISDAMYALEDIPGKGKGLVATRIIPRGTRILSEVPIVRAPESVPIQELRQIMSKQVEKLTEDDRQAVLSMHNIYADDGDDDDVSRFCGIFRTNCLPVDDDHGASAGGIFRYACRINHSCDNNAQKAWNDDIKRHTVHALRQIEKGEEITITYLDVLNSRNSRQEKLGRKLKFTCSCRLCSLPPDQSQEVDRRLEEILELDSLIGSGGLMGILMDPLRILRYIDTQVCLYNEHGPGDLGLPRAFHDAAQVAVAHGDLARAKIFFLRAAIGWTISEGDDTSKVRRVKELVQDPSKHELYGTSMRWKTAVDDMPRGLISSNDLENWLWRRA